MERIYNPKKVSLSNIILAVMLFSSIAFKMLMHTQKRGY